MKDKLSSGEEKKNVSFKTINSKNKSNVPKQKDSEIQLIPAGSINRVISLEDAYRNFVKEIDSFLQRKKKLNLTAEDMPVTVKAEIRHWVQLLGHVNATFRATAFPLLHACVKRYPLLIPLIEAGIFSVYNKARTVQQKQAKLMGIGSLLCGGAASKDPTLMSKLIIEVFRLRNTSDRDEAEMYFIVSALEQAEPTAVSAAADVIFQMFGSSFEKSYSEIRLGHLYLRLVLTERMLSCGLNVPFWLKNCLLPTEVAKFGLVLMPKSQKIETYHIFLRPFFSKMVLLHKAIIEEKERKGNSTQDLIRKKNPLIFFFKKVISHGFSEYSADHRLKTTEAIATELFKSLLSCEDPEFVIMSSVINWLVKEGKDILSDKNQALVVSLVLKKLDDIETLPDDRRSALLLIVIRALEAFPRLLRFVKRHLKHLTANDACSYADTVLNRGWRKLSTVEATVLLGVLGLPQCGPNERPRWLLDVSRRITLRGLNCIYGKKNFGTSTVDNSETSEFLKEETQTINAEETDEDVEQEGTGDIKEEENKDNFSNYGEVALITNEDFFSRFLKRCALNKVSGMAMFFEVFRTAVGEVHNDPDLIREENKAIWREIVEKFQMLDSDAYCDFLYSDLFKVLLAQFGMELLKWTPLPEEAQDLLQDSLECLKRALNEQRNVCVANSSPVKQEKNWVEVLVEVLLALCTREDKWWRFALHGAARVLSPRISAEAANSIIEALLDENVVVAAAQGPDSDEDDEWEDVNNEQDANDDDQADNLQRRADSDDESESGEDESDSDSDGDGDSDDDKKDNEYSDDEELNKSEDEHMSEEDMKMLALRAALMKEMMLVPAPVKTRAHEYGNSDESDDDVITENKDNADDSDEELKYCEEEDMDKVPIEELRKMDMRLARLLGDHIRRRKKKKPALIGDSALLMRFRNRVVDLLDGIVEGGVPPSVLLGCLVPGCLKAAEAHNSELTESVYFRLSNVLKLIRKTNKFITLENSANEVQLSNDELMDIFETALSYRDSVPEYSNALVVLMRYSKAKSAGYRSCESLCPLAAKYLEEVRDASSSKEQLLNFYTVALKLDNSKLLLEVTKLLLEKLCSSSDAAEDHDADNASGSSAQRPWPGRNAWKNISELVFSTLNKKSKSDELSAQQMFLVECIASLMQRCFNSGFIPHVKELREMTLLMKLMKKKSKVRHCPCWTSLDEAALDFVLNRRRVDKEETSRRAFTKLYNVVCMYLDENKNSKVYSIICDRKEAKRRETLRIKELRKTRAKSKKWNINVEQPLEEEYAKKTPYPPVKGQKSSLDYIFNSNDGVLDEGDEDLESEAEAPTKDSDPEDEGAAINKRRKLKQKLKMQERKDIQKQLILIATEQKELLEKNLGKSLNLPSFKRGSAYNNLTLKKKLMAKNKDKFDENTESRLNRSTFKAIKRKADEALDSDLMAGVFTKTQRVETSLQ